MNSSWGSGADVDANLGAQDNLSVDHGAYVASVVQNGAALAAAILVGDLIVQIDNTPVTDPQSLGLAKRWRTIVVESQQMRFWLEWDRWHHECARSGGQVHFLRARTSPRVNGQESTRYCQCSSVSRRTSRRRGGCNGVAQDRLTSTSG